MLHPLNTEAVDYLTQRTELMMGPGPEGGGFRREFVSERGGV